MEWNVVIENLTPIIWSVVSAIGLVIAGWVGKKASEFFDTKDKRYIVETTVKYVEQVGKALGSKEKLALAKKKALEWLQAKGLAVGEVELDILLEATVHEFFGHYSLELTEDDVKDAEEELESVVSE